MMRLLRGGGAAVLESARQMIEAGPQHPVLMTPLKEARQVSVGR